MPSTLSRVRRIASRCAGRVGATPKPQFPITTVVTPCQGEMREHAVPEHLGVVVGVDVDEARRDGAARRVEHALGAAAHLAEGATMRPPRIATSPGRPGRAGAVEERAAADPEVVVLAHRGPHASKWGMTCLPNSSIERSTAAWGMRLACIRHSTRSAPASR